MVANQTDESRTRAEKEKMYRRQNRSERRNEAEPEAKQEKDMKSRITSEK